MLQMAKKQSEKYSPKENEIQAMRLCWKNDLAYVIQPVKNSIKYNVIKFQISNNLELHFLKDNNINVEFTEYEASKKVMELYTQHSKRFGK
jgi:hypothetical protein